MYVGWNCGVRVDVQNAGRKDSGVPAFQAIALEFSPSSRIRTTLLDTAIDRVSNAGDFSVVVHTDVLVVDRLSVFRKRVDDDLIDLSFPLVLNTSRAVVNELNRCLRVLLAGYRSEHTVEQSLIAP